MAFRTRFPDLTLFAAAVCLCLPSVSRPAAAQTPETSSVGVQRTVHHIARGVDLIQEITPSSAPGGPLVVTVIEADPTVTGVRFEAALGQDRVWGTDPTFGREVLSKLAKRHKAVAAINTGFFSSFTGVPIGFHLSGGDMVTEPADGHVSFYLTKDGSTGFANFRYKGTVRSTDGGPPMSLDGLNRRPAGTKDKHGELLLFTPVFLDRTLSAPGRVEAILTGVSGPFQPNRDYTGTVERLTNGGETPIARNTVVLSGIGPGAEFLDAVAKPGAKLTIRAEVTEAGTGGVEPPVLADVVSGGSNLIADGKDVSLLRSELFGTPMSTISHPRSAIGRKADGKILLVTVDGRQKGLSRGAPLPDLALIMQRLGATDAINMDGGGSSTEVVWDNVANSPSEGVERPIANALLVYAEDLPRVSNDTLPNHLNVPDHPLKVGDIWNLAPRALAESEHAAWGARGGQGFVSQSGVFQARRTGKGLETVTVTLGSRSRTLSASFKVLGPSGEDTAGFAARLRVRPAEDESPTHATLTISIANAEGDPLAGEPVAIEVNGGTPDSPTVITNGRGNATMNVTWDNPDATRPRSITVTSPQKRFDSATLIVATVLRTPN